MTILTGIILAGGQGRRMGGQDKGLVQLDGRPLYQHVLERLRPQVDIVMINANRNIDRYQLSGCRVIQDVFDDYPGPLAGIYSGLREIEGEWAVFSACDTPAIPLNFVERLMQQRGDAPQCGCAHKPGIILLWRLFIAISVRHSVNTCRLVSVA